MSLQTLDAVTLRSQHYSETSRIVTFYSRESGLIKGIAKGARGFRGRFATSLEPMQRVRVTLSVRENRDLQTVTQADLLQPFAGIREDLFRSTYAQAVLELTSRMIWQEHPGEDVYDLLLAVLGSLEEGMGDPQLLFFTFQIHLARLLGYGMHLVGCAGCGEPPVGEMTYSLPAGAAFCRRCYPGEGAAEVVAGEVIELCARLGSGDGFAAAAVMVGSGEVRREAGRLIRHHLEYHTDTDLKLRALRLAENIEQYDMKKLSSVSLKRDRK